jgi:pyruvate/2-oxoglutarate dehydrogenase complex dihydrolipoamide acyltransferase (E2) component
MFNFTDFLVLAGMFLLRFGVPAAIVIGVGYLLKRLDKRWEAEAWAEQQTARASEQPAQRPAVPREQPATPKRAPAQAPQLPWVPPPPARETPRPQPGLAAAPAARECWDVKGCTESQKAQCAAPKHPEMPCWQARFDAEGHIPEDCVNCDTFQRYPLM